MAKILLVDDDERVLSGYGRHLRRRFEFETAQSGPEGLIAIERRGPFAVVVSDMRMPGMDGIGFLAEVKLRSPDSVRMMLSGNADMETCITAVNEGNIFRFLTKPCSPDDLTKAVQAGVEQYQLITSERELLQGTLRGCIRTLSDILSVLNPAAFSRGSRIRRYVRHMAAQLEAPHFWEYEMAATLSQIGCVAVPAEILGKINLGRPLSSEEQRLLSSHPIMGCQLLAEIPRLGLVAQVIAKQNTADPKAKTPCKESSEDEIVEFGGLLLRVSLALDRLLVQRKPFIEALSALHAEYGPDHPLIESLMSFEKDQEDRVLTRINAGELSTNMFAADDIMTTTGHVLVSKGQMITEPLRLHLLSCAQTRALKEPFLVEVLSEES